VLVCEACKVDVLVLDDLAMSTFTEESRRDLLGNPRRLLLSGPR
jgi:DNA replication protein DnaC